MTQNQLDRLPTLQRVQLRWGKRSAAIAAHLWLAVFLFGTGLLHAQIQNVRVGTTATQAVISYSAPDTSACSVQVREGGPAGPLVPDVDPSLFPGSDLDLRTVNLVAGRHRIFVAGKRVAETGLDGIRHSRALQTNTKHVFTITCGASTLTDEFTTMNAPLGMSYNDPLPADPLQPGQYAWPDFSWTDRNQWVVDPLTGFRVKQFDSPRDAIEFIGSGNFASASNLAGSSDWTTPSAAVADDASAATYAGTTQGWLFLELGVNFSNGTVHNSGIASINALVPTFNAWCASTDCATAISVDRSIQFCLTVDGVSCASDMLDATLAACTSNCGTSDYRFTPIANPKPILADWFASRMGVPTIDSTDFSKRAGTVNRAGAKVTLVNGDRFNLHWSAGTPITINSVAYTIASVDNDGALTLSGTPDGSDSAVRYGVSAAGLLVRKKTDSTHQIAIQQVSYQLETGQSALLESGGDEESFANCSPALVAGPNSEMGWHCSVSGGIYWIGQDTGTVNRLGRTVPAYHGEGDGWNQHSCSGGSFWDWTDGNTFYCPTQSFQGHLFILKFVYNGSNVDVGDLGYSQAVTACGNPPCWTITNLTPGDNALDLQLTSFHPDWAASHFHTNSISMFGRMGSTNSLTFLARRDPNNDTLSFLFRFDLNTGRIVGATPTWRYWPLRWEGMHGPANLNDPAWIQISATFLRGPYTGNDWAAGNGPYYSTVTSGGISADGQPCPARPADSPIAVSDWPTGNRCLTITVDGEPGDPTPKTYTSGTISVSGTNVTGTDTSWTPYLDGSQILIGGTLYKFTYVSDHEATLDIAPTGTFTNVPYTMYVDLINDPRVGNPNFSYLQDAEVQDIFCATNQVPCQTVYSNEFMRLIVKSGNTWTLQRGYAGSLPQQQTFSLNAGAWLVAFPSSCYWAADYPCAEGRGVWNAIDNPYGYNANQTTVVKDLGDKGCCHSTRQNGVNVNAGGLICPTRGGYAATGCYFARYNGLPAAFTDPGFVVSNNPIFHNMVGVGSPNGVESHPSHNQISPFASANEMRWISDSRPFLGDFIYGDVTGVPVAGNLYKFAAPVSAQLRPARLNRRVFPTMAACGVNPLIDVSGPASSISSGDSDKYKYCYAKAGGECVSGSSPGDFYVNCPQIKTASCVFQGIGNSDSETRDICVTDMGAHTMNITQVGVDKPDPDGLNSRRVTAAFSRYHWLNQFWNAKVLPNGRWMLVWSNQFQGQRNSALLVKLPPFPAPDSIIRNDFIPYNVTVAAPQVTGATVTNAVVQFGYDKNYFCTSRQEACVQGAPTDYAFKSENPPGVPCANGCVIPVQSLSQRVMYYQVLLRDASNTVVGRLQPEAVALK